MVLRRTGNQAGYWHFEGIMFDEVRALLGDVLKLGPRTLTLRPDTPLLGSLPELDSMAVVAVITSLEQHYGFTVDDDEISGDAFATLGSLVRFVEYKVGKKTNGA